MKFAGRLKLLSWTDGVQMIICDIDRRVVSNNNLIDKDKVIGQRIIFSPAKGF